MVFIDYNSREMGHEKFLKSSRRHKCYEICVGERGADDEVKGGGGFWVVFIQNVYASAIGDEIVRCCMSDAEPVKNTGPSEAGIGQLYRKSHLEIAQSF